MVFFFFSFFFHGCDNLFLSFFWSLFFSPTDTRWLSLYRVQENKRRDLAVVCGLESSRLGPFYYYFFWHSKLACSRSSYPGFPRPYPPLSHYTKKRSRTYAFCYIDKLQQGPSSKTSKNDRQATCVGCGWLSITRCG